MLISSQKIISFLKFLKNNLDQEKLTKDEIFQIGEIVDSFKAKLGIKPSISDSDITSIKNSKGSLKALITNKILNKVYSGFIIEKE